MATGLQSLFQTQGFPQQNFEHIVHALHVLLALMVVLSKYGEIFLCDIASLLTHGPSRDVSALRQWLQTRDHAV
jgi:hypothetical protein